MKTGFGRKIWETSSCCKTAGRELYSPGLLCAHPWHMHVSWGGGVLSIQIRTACLYLAPLEHQWTPLVATSGSKSLLQHSIPKIFPPVLLTEPQWNQWIKAPHCHLQPQNFWASVFIVGVLTLITQPCVGFPFLPPYSPGSSFLFCGIVFQINYLHTSHYCWLFFLGDQGASSPTLGLSRGTSSYQKKEMKCRQTKTAQIFWSKENDKKHIWL